MERSYNVQRKRKTVETGDFCRTIELFPTKILPLGEHML